MCWTDEQLLLIKMIDTAYAARFVAATREMPEYDDDEYERCVRVTKGLIMALVEGDEQYADALEWAWLDSQEDIRYYMTNYTRDVLVYESGADRGDDIARRLGFI